MAETGDNFPPFPGHVPPAVLRIPQLTHVTDYLQEMSRIGTFYGYHLSYMRRYVDLKKQDIFDSLVDLYTQAFHTRWYKLERLAKAYPPPQAYKDEPIRYIAANYISAWMYDLYVSNQEACSKICDVAYSEYYHLDLVHMSGTYDVFLVALSAQIRPTSIKFGPDASTLFIPIISTPEAAEENPFGIRGWSLNHCVVHGLIHNLKERGLFKMEALSKTTFGRPAWLLDWQSDNLAYAWFPFEGNFSLDDVAIAYILGVACSPALAPRDTDEWQMLPGNVLPDHTNSISISRIRPLTNHSSIEYRTIETRIWSLPTSYRQAIYDKNGLETDDCIQAQQEGQAGTSQPKKKARTVQTSRPRDHPTEAEEAHEEVTGEQVESLPTPVQTTETRAGIIFPNFYEARIVDYLYHAKVVGKYDLTARQAAHWHLIYNGK